ncbi:hypothetical protein [Sporomusa aerivorans]|uniref:hypothetical protein n=1 Tax=Sporomusa aerivorans TaxID=204936 RepID=UPI00352B4489
MNRNLARLTIVLTLLLVLITSAGCAANSSPTPPGANLPPANPASDPNLPAGYVILDRQTGTVTADGKPRDILLIGKRPSANSIFTDDLSILVREEANPNTVTVKLPNVGGYDSKLFIGDFDGDKVNDVLVTIPTGGSGGLTEHRIVTFAGEPKIIFGSEENKGLLINGHFAERFKFELRELSTGRTTIMDLAQKKDTYVEAGLYNSQGKLLKEQSGSVNPFGGLTPFDVGRDGTYELRGQQRITGMYNADSIGYIYSIWKYENGKWVPKQIEVASVLLAYGEK